MTQATIRVNVSADSEHQAAVAAAIIATGLGHERTESWRTDAALTAIESPESGWTLLSSSIADRNSYASSYLIIAKHFSDSLLIASRHQDYVRCRVVSRSSEEAASHVAALRELLPEADHPEDNAVRMTFWNLSDGKVRCVSRRIVVPDWSELRDNYHWRTRSHLEALVQRPPALAAGKLILWHGPPGTGKTWALRALLHEWRHWAEPHYILDPENFFSQSASYMMSVIMEHDGNSYADADDDAEDDARWRLLIIEDAGELLGKDARAQAGQGLARLLNLCDGLVGQGLRVLILITTNEDVGTMHPAVIRRGRCIANIRFDLLSPDERRAWSAAHGSSPDDETPALLADLYAADQIVTPRTMSIAGFHSRSHRT